MVGEKSTDQLHLRGRPLQPHRDRAGVLREHPRAGLHRVEHFRFAMFSGLENRGSQPRHGHLIRLHHPADEVLEPVERERAEDLLRERRDRLVEIEMGEHQPQPLHREIVAAAAVAEQLPPAASLFDLRPAASVDRRARPGDHRDPIRGPECRGQPRFPIAAHRELRLRPGLGGEGGEADAILRRRAPGEEDADVRDLARQCGEEPAQAVVGGQPEVRRGQHPVPENPVFIGVAGQQHPFGLGAAAFDAEDALWTFHASTIMKHRPADKPAFTSFTVRFA